MIAQHDVRNNGGDGVHHRLVITVLTLGADALIECLSFTNKGD